MDDVLGEDIPIDEVMKTLLAQLHERVMFSNLHRPTGWEVYLNRLLVESLARWPKAQLIDWDTMAHHEQCRFIEDQTHLSYAGSEAYVNALATSP